MRIQQEMQFLTGMYWKLQHIAIKKYDRSRNLHPSILKPNGGLNIPQVHFHVF